MSGAVVPFPRQHRSELLRELARRMREASDLWLRVHGRPLPRLLKEAARTEAEADRCAPHVHRGAPVVTAGFASAGMAEGARVSRGPVTLAGTTGVEGAG